jgi:hypothetical protein
VAWGVNTTFYGNTSTSSSTKDNPSISCNGNNITVAYVDGTADDVIIGNSTDNGATWTWSNPVTTCADRYASVERRGQRIYVVYKTIESAGCDNGDVIFFNSTDGGSTWGSTTTIFDADLGCGVDLYDYTCYASNSLAVNGTGGSSDTIHVAVQKGVKVGGTPTSYISYRNSTNSGTGWNTASDLTSSGNAINYPSVNFYGSNVYISYWDSTANDIYFLNNSNYGAGSFTNTRIDKIGAGTAWAKYSSTAINNNTQPCVFWQQDNTSTNRENIVYRARTNTNWDDTVYNVTTDFLQHQYVNTRYNYNASGIDIVWVNGTDTTKNITYEVVNCTYTNRFNPLIIITMESDKVFSRKIITRPNNRTTIYGQVYYLANGSAYTNQQLNFTYDSTSLGANTTNGTGYYWFTFTIPYEGTYNLTVNTTDSNKNSGQNVTTMLIATHPINVRFRLSYHLGSNKDDDVYRIGTSGLTNQTIDASNINNIQYSSNITHPYVCSYDKTEYSDGLTLGLIHSGKKGDMSFVNFSATAAPTNYTLELKQRTEGTAMLLTYTKSDCKNIDDKMYLVESNTIPSHSFSSFGYSIPTDTRLLIQFRNDRIQINGTDRIAAGNYKLCVEKIGVSSGNKPMIGVGRC